MKAKGTFRNNIRTFCQKKENLFLLLLLAALLLTGFVAHRLVPFMMDDLWYGTNLVTGEALKSPADIFQSQVWHFFNWGGRSVTHAVLQLTLMSGETCADVCNLAMTALLTYLVCVFIQKKTLPCFVFVHACIYACNANIKMSMLWQAGAANYVYSSVWILLFCLPYLRIWQTKKLCNYPGICLWILPLGLMAGWSNENVGPCCFLLAFTTWMYHVKICKEKGASWLLLGALTSFVGACLVILAPGNFVRSDAIVQPSLYQRLFAMLTAGTDYLLPVLLPMILLLLLYVFCYKASIAPYQWVLLLMALLSYGAMVLSPHYPDRATFGTMLFCIAVFADCLFALAASKNAFYKLSLALTWLYGFVAMASLFLVIAEYC